MEFFNRLGELTRRRWMQHEGDEASFPAVAERALGELPPSQHVRYEQVIEAFLFDGTLPPQGDHHDFGQPPITVYQDSRFRIDVLCWMDGTTSLHQHAFSGAFHLLRGSSLHSRYRFERTRGVTSRFLVGDVMFEEMEMLQSGDTRPIIAGDRFIHSHFHLDRPSISVVIRTELEHAHQPQYTYLKPHVAYDPSFEVPLADRRRMLLDMLARTDPAAYRAHVERLVLERPLPEVFEVLRHRMAQSIDEGVRPLLEKAREHRGEIVDRLVRTLLEDRRLGDLAARRDEITDPDHRFLLALLKNVPDRRHLFEMAERRSGQPGREVVLRWLRELTQVTPDGAVHLLEINVLVVQQPGGPRLAFDELLHTIIVLMLDGETAIHDQLARRFPAAVIEAERTCVDDVIRLLRHGSLHPLFIA